MSVILENGKALKKELLSLPESDHIYESDWYDSLLVVPTGKMHDSGWSTIAVIGCRKSEAIEILAYPDDISWPSPYDSPEYSAPVRTDAYRPSGILRLWGSYDFRVRGYSSLDILVRKQQK